MQNISQSSAYTDISRFTAMRADARRDGDGTFATVAKEFEALFIELMLKAARDATPEGGLFDSHELKLYREMFDSQVALTMADQGGLGFEAVLRDQLDIESPSDPRSELKLPQPTHFPPALTSPRESGRAQDVVPVKPAGPLAQAHSASEFIQALRPLAEVAASKLGLAPDILVAQAALETGWGRHTISDSDGRSSHNIFAIKADSGWRGDSIDVKTVEYINGRAMRINASFRAYRDGEAAFNDYVEFLNSHPRYAEALEHGGDSRKFVTALQSAGYATDPHYAEKILEIKDRIAAQSMSAMR